MYRPNSAPAITATVIGKCHIEATQRGFAVYVEAKRTGGPKRGQVQNVDLAYVHTRYEDAQLTATSVDRQLAGRCSTASHFTRPGMNDRPVLIKIKGRRLTAQFAD